MYVLPYPCVLYTKPQAQNTTEHKKIQTVRNTLISESSSYHALTNIGTCSFIITDNDLRRWVVGNAMLSGIGSGVLGFGDAFFPACLVSWGFVMENGLQQLLFAVIYLDHLGLELKRPLGLQVW